MEHLAQYRNNIFVLLIFCISCSHVKTNLKYINQDQVSMKHSGGVLYVNDSIFSGVLFSLDPTTKDTLSLASFLNGREHGTWKQFYPDGTLKEIRYFKNGRKQGDYNGWWENGAKKFSFHFIDDEYNGTCYEWASDKQLIHEANYIAGHEAGEQRAWYPNGKVKSNYTIINNRRYGLLGTKNCKNVSDSVFTKR